MTEPTILLSDGATTLALSADLYWADEHDWTPVVQSAERSITGALIVSVATRQGGRPITLRAYSEASAWMARADVALLQAWAAMPGKTLTLTLRGVARQVMFRHHEAPALEATPVMHFSDVDDADPYVAAIKLMEL